MTHYVYFIVEVKARYRHRHCKIGVANDVEKRLVSMQTGNPRELEIAAQLGPYSRKEAYAFEKRMHAVFAKWHVRGEWFHATILRNMHRIRLAKDDIYDHRKHQEQRAA